ncbi:hypothetical protein [Nibrella saemangeumensis]|uniref:hypothetical protein n=1 Tax=Nibrella saemangeumensis TaxID=1084526 RepID=UPI0031EF62A9
MRVTSLQNKACQRKFKTWREIPITAKRQRLLPRKSPAQGRWQDRQEARRWKLMRVRPDAEQSRVGKAVGFVP